MSSPKALIGDPYTVALVPGFPLSASFPADPSSGGKDCGMTVEGEIAMKTKRKQKQTSPCMSIGNGMDSYEMRRLKKDPVISLQEAIQKLKRSRQLRFLYSE